MASLEDDATGAAHGFYRHAPPTQLALARQAAAAVLQALHPAGGRVQSPGQIIDDASRDSSLLSLVSTLDASGTVDAEITLNDTTTSSSSSSFYSTPPRRTAAIVEAVSPSSSSSSQLLHLAICTHPNPAQGAFTSLRDYALRQRRKQASLARALLHRSDSIFGPCFAVWAMSWVSKLLRRWSVATRTSRTSSARHHAAASGVLCAWSKAARCCRRGRLSLMKPPVVAFGLLVRYRRRQAAARRRSECFSIARLLTSSFHAWR